MASLSQDIEMYLKALLAEAGEDGLVVQRSTLSEKFACVPSQINYVLRTRFSLTNGYIVETRRGGGGYVRIQSVPLDTAHDFQPLMEAAEKNLSEQDEEGILSYLVSQDVIPADVGTLLESLMKERVLQDAKTMTTSELRAHLMRHLLAHMSIGANKKDHDAASTDATDNIYEGGSHHAM
ncbi:MAG: CtsR family transcriptional regulator [Peptococcaceae bacterium]|nr:CtsR family transcriptional regulator [Peptococcaceae bacterium]